MKPLLPLVLVPSVLVCAALGAGYVATRPSSPTPETKPSRAKLPTGTTPAAKKDPTRAAVPADAALDTLVAQLHRRFSDRQNVQFGFERVQRPLVRVHAGPEAGKNDLIWYESEDGEGKDGYDPKRVRKDGDRILIRTEAGTWIEYGEQSRPQMFPENAAERRAMADLNRAGREVAIYTFGRFDGEKFRRGRGPAYLRQLGPDAPAAKMLADVAIARWKGEHREFPGYTVRTEMIAADASCLKCHNDQNRQMEEDPQLTLPKLPALKAGERLGLVLILESKKVRERSAEPHKLKSRDQSEEMGYPAWG